MTEAHLSETLNFLNESIAQFQSETDEELRQQTHTLEQATADSCLRSREVEELSKAKRDLLQRKLSIQEQEAAIDRDLSDVTKALSQTKSEQEAQEADKAARQTAYHFQQDEVLKSILECQTALDELLQLQRSIRQQFNADTSAMLETVDEAHLAEEQSLIQHEQTADFIRRCVELPLRQIYAPATVRTREGRIAVLEARLEQACAAFQVSPLALYFQEDIPLAPTRYRPPRGLLASESDEVGDDTLSGASSDEELGAFLQDVESSPLRSTGGDSGLCDDVEVEEAAEFFLRNIALYGHLIRIFGAARKRVAKRRASGRGGQLSSRDLSALEVDGIMMILDSVTIDERV
ncbi:MAG: hypothetical protein J0M19_12065, partial [Sphingomonadales bacterium]|nr:hypothetical protein [Sphingomonadales bacterium]